MPLTFYREDRLLHKMFLVEIIPVFPRTFLKHFASVSRRPAVFRLHSRFSSTHGDQFLGAASILTGTFRAMCPHVLYAAFNKGLLNELILWYHNL